jgi:flagellar hook protein FlgE
MSVGSFSASLSGLNANQQKLAVIGNNLANINTIAFKASTVSFSDLVSQSVGGPGANPAQIGLGVAVGSITPTFTQGSIENTGISTHVAIQGPGFFVVGDSGSRAYTRAGNFSFDANGVLVTFDGQPVQGYSTPDPVTGLIQTSGQPTAIIIPPGVLRPPVATTLFSTTSNLDAGAPVGATFTTSVQTYDALGDPHVLSIVYEKTAVGAWDYTISVDGADVTGGTPGTAEVLATGSVEFGPDGLLTDVDGAAAADVTITSPAWANGAAPTDFVWDLVGADGTPSVTGYSSASATSSITQNGVEPGAVSSIISIDNEGRLLASFGLGRTVTVAQIALATFNNPQGLVKLGTNLWSESEAAGNPSIGTAGTGGRGTLIGSALEQSNVDIAQEFTQMILAQRGYQANSKSITVADELLLETLNLKR